MAETKLRIMTDGDQFWIEELRPILFGLMKVWWRGSIYLAHDNEFAARKELERRQKLHEPTEVTL